MSTRLIRRPRSVLSTFVSLALLGPFLAGCGLLRPEPPAELRQAADHLADKVGRLNGVADSTAEVRAIDWKDRPGEWRAVLRVEADSPDLEVLPGALRSLTEATLIDGRPIDLKLLIPSESGIAPVSFGDLSPGSVATVQVLRSRPEVLAIDGAFLGADGANVSIRPDVTVADATEMLRQSLPQHDGPEALTASWQTVATGDDERSVTIDVTASWPSPQVLGAIAEIVALPAVTRVWASRPTEYRETGYVSVSSSDAAAVWNVIDAIPIDDANTTHFDVIAED